MFTILPIVALSIAFLAWLAFYMASRAIEGRMRAQVNATVAQTSVALSRWIDDNFRAAELIAANPLVQESLASNQPEAAKAYLEAYFQKSKGLENLFLASPAGQLLVMGAGGDPNQIDLSKIPVYMRNAAAAREGEAWGELRYTFKGVAKHASFATDSRTSWTIMAIVDRFEFYQTSRKLGMAIGGIGLVSLLAVGFGIFFANARFIVKPMTLIIDGLNAGARHVQSASQQVSQSSQQMAEGANEQASSLEETSASLEQMASMTNQNADNARQANVAAGHARGATDNGQRAMALPALFAHFGVGSMEGLKRRLNDDIWPVEVPYHHPPANHIACAFDFAKDTGDYEHRTLTSPGHFEDMTDPAAVEDFPWPDPREHMYAAECRAAVAAVPADFARLGIMWSAHFQDACAAFGMENALMTLLTAPEMFQAVIDSITRFYLEANAIFYDAAGDRLDAVLIGNDLGSQSGLMLSPELIREFVLPGTRQLVAQAKARGYKVIHHSCGAVREIIPDLIAAGVEAIHPIQALAVGMEPKGLRHDFGDRVAFCGGVDAQNLLVNGAPEQVQEKVRQLHRILPTGLIIAPSHEAILPDIPPANIAALLQTATEQS